MMETRRRLLCVLEEFGNHYPAWRFGQMVSNIAGWNDTDTREIGDDQLLETAEAHLRRRFGESPRQANGTVSAIPERGELFQALEEPAHRYSGWRLGQLIWNLAALAHVNIYDVEDAQLLVTVRSREPGLQWFEWYASKLVGESTIRENHRQQSYRCPCCHYRTLHERGGFEICPVCYWEDDGQDDVGADTVRGGPNGSLSLTLAGENYSKYGVYDPKYIEHVRPPRSPEM
jgi:hypothetical protein